MADVSKIIRIRSDTWTGRCEECDSTLPGVPRDDDFQGKVNHYLENHDYELLHVGGESERDDEGNPYQLTVAILGKPR